MEVRFGLKEMLYDSLYMATTKLTVTVQVGSIRELDRWVRAGRYPNRSRATQAALDLLARRHRLPTLEWALAHPRPLSPTQRSAWEGELKLVDAGLAEIEPPLAD